MTGNLETFQDELAASGFPPLVNKLAGADFRGRIATRDLGPLRLVNLVALGVVAIAFGPPLMRRLPRLHWLEAMGSASLPVFCAHLVLALLALALAGEPRPERPLAIDLAILVLSFAALYAVALISRALDRHAAAVQKRFKEKVRAARRPDRGAMRSRSSTPRSRPD